MPDYADNQPRPIEPLSTHIAGFIGVTEKAPKTVAPVPLAGYAEFSRAFGGPLSEEFGRYRHLANAVRLFFENGGKKCYVVSAVTVGALRARAGASRQGPGRVAPRQLNDHRAFLRGVRERDFTGTDGGPGRRSGIEAFRDIDELSVVAMPGVADRPVQMALIAHCEALGDRIAVLDLPEEVARDPRAIDCRAIFSSSYAAFYHPWLRIAVPGGETIVPPSGAVAGVYADNDIRCGVHAAPSNIVLRGIAGLAATVAPGDIDVMAGRSVNAIRELAGRGIRVWGARTCTEDAAWKHVNVRRLVTHLQGSIAKGTAWAAFEPNDGRLWARVRQATEEFLLRAWKSGALQGAGPDQAFFVKVDRTTMTQADIDAGKLVIMAGVAAVKPAEFIIFRVVHTVSAGTSA